VSNNDKAGHKTAFPQLQEQAGHLAAIGKLDGAKN
jgi:hypothetical protein